ncbi:MAG: hypothetical protein H7123_07595 [Thermoleophilia bacterium]|nr:hypothetical protein [Thermoleophilia bacterium]
MAPFRRFLLCAALAALAAPAASYAWASENVQSARAAVGIGRQSLPGVPTTSSATAGSPIVQLPATPPRLVDAHNSTYGYQTDRELAAMLTGEASASDKKSGAGASSSAAGNSATITVSAVVLPVHIIVVHNGAITAIYSNTRDPLATNSL